MSIADGALAMMSLYVDEYLATGAEPGPGHYILTGRFACYDVYECADGRFLSVAAIEPQVLAQPLPAASVSNASPTHRPTTLCRTRSERPSPPFSLTRSRDEWVAELGPDDTCVAPVSSVAEAVGDEQYLARGAIVDAVHEEHGPFQQAAPIWAGTEQPTMPYEIRKGTVTDTADPAGGRRL